MIRNIPYRINKNKLKSKKKLADDAKLLKSAKELFVNDDKLRNIYKLDEAVCKKYLVENITKIYKETTKALVKSINKDTKKFTEKLKIADRMECMVEPEAYIMIKDHNKSFP